MVLLLAKVLKDEIDMNGFTKHKIKRISVSSVNKFREAPDAWACHYLGGARFGAGWAAWQGNAVETGVETGLFNGYPIDECVRKALDELNERSTLAPNKAEEMEKRKPIVKRMVTAALEQMLPLGEPDMPPEGKRQHEINIPVRFREGEDGTVNNLGYLDFKYTTGKHADNPLVVDLKTTSKSPSKWSLSHAIQAAVYERAVQIELGQKPTVKFLYVLTRQKDPFTWLTMEDSAFYLNQFKRTVKQMEALLSLSDDAETLIQAIPHNPSSFYWSNAEEISQHFYQ